jgi:competence protein ComEC
MTTADNAAAIKEWFQDILGNRYLVLVALAYIAGIVLGWFWITEPPHFYWFLLCFLLFLAALWLFRLTGIFRVSLLLLIALSGAAACIYTATPAEKGILQYAGQHLYLEGVVIEEPVFDQDLCAYQLQVDLVETREGREKTSGRLLMQIYSSAEDAATFQFGERLRLRAVITEPKGLRNPGGFDYRFFLRSQGIDALVYPYVSQIDRLGTGRTSSILGSAVNLRQQMTAFIDSTLPAPSSSLLIAILFGKSGQLPENVEENFRRAGAGHLMAVSGLHVGLVAALIIGLWRRLGLKGRLPLVLAIILVFAYAYLTGMRPSALRAAIMVSMGLAAVLLERESDLPTAVALAALVTLFINPLLLFTVGFQLSYVATLALIYLYRPLEYFLKTLHLPLFIRSPLAITITAQIGVLPLSVYYFHHLPAGALIFNLLFLPLVAFVVGFGLAGALIGLIFPLVGELLLWASRPLLEIMLYISGFSSLPGFYLAFNPPKSFTLVLIYLSFIFILVIYYRWAKHSQGEGEVSFARYLIDACKNFIFTNLRLVMPAATIVLLVAVILVWTGALFPREQLLTITFIDVGQGASALVEAPCGTVILIDAGGEPAYSGDPGRIGEMVVLPFLRYKGISKIDLAVVTHPHEDHFGGFLPLLEQIPIDGFLISPVAGDSPYYNALLEQAEGLGVAVAQASVGQSWHCSNGLQLDVLGPPADLIRSSGSDLNNNSLVLLLSYGEIKVMFTGDIEDSAVIELLSRNSNLEANLLQVPHHGGFLPSAVKLLEAVQPDLAVIQVGTNSFGHPHPQILDALEQAGTMIYRTDLHGAVVCRTDGREFDIAVTGLPVPVQ